MFLEQLFWPNFKSRRPLSAKKMAKKKPLFFQETRNVLECPKITFLANGFLAKMFKVPIAVVGDFFFHQNGKKNFFSKTRCSEIPKNYFLENDFSGKILSLDCRGLYNTIFIKMVKTFFFPRLKMF